MRKGRGGLVVLKITKKNVYPACPINDLLSIKTVFKFKTRYFGLKYYKVPYENRFIKTFGPTNILHIFTKFQLEFFIVIFLYQIS